MSKTFTPITESEFDALLKAEKGWNKEVQAGSNERVYTFNLPSNPDVQIKVYSSVTVNQAMSRACGQDAIRVCAINVRTLRGIRKSTRINRVAGWEERTKNRIVEMIQDIKSN